MVTIRAQRVLHYNFLGGGFLCIRSLPSSGSPLYFRSLLFFSRLGGFAPPRFTFSPHSVTGACHFVFRYRNERMSLNKIAVELFKKIV